MTLSEKGEPMLDTKGPVQLTEHATRALITKCYSFSPFSVHFIKHSAKLHGISESEFVRRLVDHSLIERVIHDLYKVPQTFCTSIEIPIPQPSPHRLAALKRGTVSNGQQSVA
jgi:hypothetical protein